MCSTLDYTKLSSNTAVLWLQAILIFFIYGDKWKAAVWNSSSILAVFLCNIHQLLEHPTSWCYCFQVSNLKSWVSIIALSHSILVGLKQREKFIPVIIKSLFLWNIEYVICMWIFSDFVSSFVLTLDIGGIVEINCQICKGCMHSIIFCLCRTFCHF